VRSFLGTFRVTNPIESSKTETTQVHKLTAMNKRATLGDGIKP